ncbi:MAG: insulinase family protein [Gammaproteobacteria bacterium]|nr:insulinase family protein [Gammaproteobacteria bacterium]
MATKIFSKVLLLLGLSFSGQLFAAPEIQSWQTDNGARVNFVPVMDLPMLDVRVVFDAGSARDNGIGGVALLTNGLLAEGAGKQSAQKLAEQFEAVGADFSNGSLKDMAWVSLRSLREDRYLQPALKNLKNILSQPDFLPESFNRELNRMKISRQASKQSPSTIASEAFYKALYDDHPYALPSGGTDESLQRLTLGHVTAFYKQYYVARNAVISIVGQMTRQQAEEMANELVSGLASGERAEALPEVKPLTASKTIRIDFPSRQSHVLVGQPGTRRGDADYFALYVANHPFGGSGFTSRLVDEVREKRGLAYSVYSYFSPMRADGPFMLGLQTRNDQAEQALDIVNKELQKYVAEGPTDDELNASLQNITGGFPLKTDSNKKIIEYLSMIGFYDLPLDYLNTFIGKVKAVNQSAIKDVLQRRVQPDRMITVIVGGQSSAAAAGG